MANKRDPIRYRQISHLPVKILLRISSVWKDSQVPVAYFIFSFFEKEKLSVCAESFSVHNQYYCFSLNQVARASNSSPCTAGTAGIPPIPFWIISLISSALYLEPTAVKSGPPP